MRSARASSVSLPRRKMSVVIADCRSIAGIFVFLSA
jgi:hypothetical protein